jgi:uncharacterized protein (UPF0261 family)
LTIENCRSIVIIDQVIGPGGLDCIADVQEGIPARFQGRKFYYHDFRRCARPSVEELRRVAQVMAERLNRARGPVKVLLPLRCWSEADKEGGPLYDPKGNQAFGEELKRRLKPRSRSWRWTPTSASRYTPRRRWLSWRE